MPCPQKRHGYFRENQNRRTPPRISAGLGRCLVNRSPSLPAFAYWTNFREHQLVAVRCAVKLAACPWVGLGFGPPPAITLFAGVVSSGLLLQSPARLPS